MEKQDLRLQKFTRYMQKYVPNKWKIVILLKTISNVHVLYHKEISVLKGRNHKFHFLTIIVKLEISNSKTLDIKNSFLDNIIKKEN